jgi:tRNA dimethylallyltransferase
LKRANHALYASQDAGAAYSVGQWLRDVTAHLSHWRQLYPTLIFTGGTGLYFEALTKGLAEVPPVPYAISDRLRSELEQLGSADMHLRLELADAASAVTIKPTDGQRIIRALGVVEATGRSILEWQKQPILPLIDLAASDVLALVIDKGVELGRMRIAERFNAMVHEGAVDEVAAMLARDLKSDLPAMRAIGVPEISAYLRGEYGLDEAAKRAIISSAQYAKRQRTWFRNRFDGNWSRLSDHNLALDRLNEV